MSAAARPASGLPPSARPVDPARLGDVLRAAAGAARAGGAPRQSLEAALDTIHDGLDGAFVSALVPEHDRLWLVGSRGYAIVPDGLPVTLGVVGRAVRTGRVQYIPDLAADPDFFEVASGVLSELAVPLTLHDEVVGVVNIETTGPLPRQAPKLVRPFVEALAPVLAAVGESRTIDLAALSRLSVYISSLRDPGEIVALAAAIVPRALPIETSQVLLRAEDGSLRVAASCVTPRSSRSTSSARTSPALPAPRCARRCSCRCGPTAATSGSSSAAAAGSASSTATARRSRPCSPRRSPRRSTPPSRSTASGARR
jgi:hypothetical protein